MARFISTREAAIAPAPSRKAPVRARQLGHDRRRLVAELGQQQLGDVALRPGLCHHWADVMWQVRINLSNHTLYSPG